MSKLPVVLDRQVRDGHRVEDVVGSLEVLRWEEAVRKYRKFVFISYKNWSYRGNNKNASSCNGRPWVVEVHSNTRAGSVQEVRCAMIEAAIRSADKLAATYWQFYEDLRVEKIRAAGRTTVEEF